MRVRYTRRCGEVWLATNHVTTGCCVCKNRTATPEPVAVYSYQLDAAGGLLNPQPLEGGHLLRKSVYFSFTGEYSKATFWCCNVIGGTLLGKVAITAEYLGLEIAISGGLFSGDIYLYSWGPAKLVFYGNLKLDLLSETIENESVTIAEYFIQGTLRDGSPLSTDIHSSSSYFGPDYTPYPWVSITVDP